MPWEPVLLPWRRVTLALVSPQLIEVQAEYHRKSLTLLQAVLPQIKAQQGERMLWGWGGVVESCLPAG